MFDDPYLVALSRQPRCWLEEQMQNALSVQVSGQQIMSHSFEANGVTFTRTDPPKEIVRQIQTVLNYLDAQANNQDALLLPQKNPIINFNRRYLGT